MPCAPAAGDVKTAIAELTSAGHLAGRRLDGHDRIMVLRLLGERVAALEAGSDVATCRYCERSFVFNRTLYRVMPKTCFTCRILRRVADRH